MAVPYHTHTFEIPVATKEDVITGVATDKALTPASVGTAAAKNIDDFATADQGHKADNAVQPDDLAAVATSGNYGDLGNRPQLGSASTHDVTEFATATAGALAATALQPTDVGSAAYKNEADFVPVDDLAYLVSYLPQTATADQKQQAVINIGAGTQIFNWIVNGDFSINQRNAVAKVPAVNVVGFDRWIGHANGARQVVERLPVGTYTLLWSGGGTCYVESTASTAPIVFNQNAPGDVNIIVNANATNVMVLSGDWSEADPGALWSLCRRTPQEELKLCRWHYERRFLWSVPVASTGRGFCFSIALSDKPANYNVRLVNLSYDDFIGPNDPYDPDKWWVSPYGAGPRCEASSIFGSYTVDKAGNQVTYAYALGATFTPIPTLLIAQKAYVEAYTGL